MGRRVRAVVNSGVRLALRSSPLDGLGPPRLLGPSRFRVPPARHCRFAVRAAPSPRGPG